MNSQDCKSLDENTCKSREDCIYVNGVKRKFCRKGKNKNKKKETLETRNNIEPDPPRNIDVITPKPETTPKSTHTSTPTPKQETPLLSSSKNRISLEERKYNTSDDDIEDDKNNSDNTDNNNKNNNDNDNDNDKNNINSDEFVMNNNDDIQTLKTKLLDYLSRTIDSIDKEDNRIKELFKHKETIERKTFEYLNDKNAIGIYPHILDPDFNVKVASKKEFADNAYDTKPKDVIKESELLCSRDFELAPHQKFVKTFMSSYTPYNSLFLYHGLGTGKTCSAISICEEIREYMKLMNTNSKIHIIASPNVQENFKLQLFDKRKLVKLKNGWSLNTCAGNRLLLESSPVNDDKLTIETISKRINALIDKYYSFKGYSKFSNSVKKDISGNSFVKQKKIISKKYSNSLIVIDEVHNIRIDDDNPNKDVAKYLVEIIKYSKNVKLLFLSATPMFHDYKEIIFLVNLMNLNDGRMLLKPSDIFDNDGNFLTEDDKEIGRERFIDKTRGYFSFVRGENKFSFPYRIYPEFFSLSNSLKSIEYPIKKKDGIGSLTNSIKHLDLFVCEMTEYQTMVYDLFIQKYRDNNTLNFNIYKDPLKSVNMVYPPMLFNIKNDNNHLSLNEFKENYTNTDLSELVGVSGLKNCMQYTSQLKEFEYKKECLDQYGSIFNEKELIHYSGKLYEIIQRIKKSKGVVLIYSQFIEAGCVPIALALEELGIKRSNSSEATSLFKTPPTNDIDANTLLPRNQHNEKSEKSFKPAKYVMITGNKLLSPDNKSEVIAATNETNVYGNDVKVIIISKAGSEGIDFKFIRQIHILDPWYNLYRNEQTIGRGVRYCSHSLLPFKERNVEIYTYASILNKNYENNDYEVIDMEMYRYAEEKALQIGQVSRVIKQNAVDCILNKGLQENKSTESVYEISLSSGGIIKYNIDDKQFSGLCDYMDTCNYNCLPDENFTHNSEMFGKDTSTYKSHYMESESEYIIKKVTQLFRNRYVFTKDELVQEISINNSYTNESINYALTKMIEDHHIVLKDMFGREGYLENIEEYYMFKPLEIKDGKLTMFERKKPIDFKHREIQIKIKQNDKVDVDVDVDVEASKVLQKYNGVFDDYMSSMKTGKISENLSEWLKESINCIQNLSIRYNVETTIFIEFIVQNMFDLLKPDDKLNIIQELLQKPKNVYNDFENLLYKYVMSSFYYSITNEEEEINFVVINQIDNIKSKKTMSTKYYVVSKKGNKIQFVEPLPTEVDSIEKYIKTKTKYIVDNLYDLIGFLHLDKKNVMHFKTKWVQTEKGNTCVQSAKNMIIDKINTLQKLFTNHQYTQKNKLKKSYLCCELEIILRYLNNIRKDKIFFVNAEQTVLFKILN